MQQRTSRHSDRQYPIVRYYWHCLKTLPLTISMRLFKRQAAQSFLGTLLATLLFSTTATADFKAVPLESLAPTDEHRQATAVVFQLMQRYHLNRVTVDDELSEQIFDRYIDSLDPQKAFFMASDIEEFYEYRQRFDNALRNARLQPVFDIFKRFRVRVEERADFARGLLKQDFDFTIDEFYTFNREDEPWAPSQKAVDELWRQRVKNDVLSLRLAEQSNEELVETLEERYERMERRVSQIAKNEVFQVFVNAYTLSVEPHTSYFSPRSSENFSINMRLSLEGIGASLRTVDEYTVVQSVIPGGPAAVSELLSAEDRIVGVGQDLDKEIVDVVSWPLSDVVDLIRGPKGSTVRLEILAAGEPAGNPPTLITLVRDKIKLEEQAAKSSIVDVPGKEGTRRFGVIDLPTFYLDAAARAEGVPDYRSTTRDVRRLIEELTTADGGVDGIIIDLRGNGGGALVEATELTGLFIKTGPVVQIQNSSGELNAEVDNDPEVAYAGPLAVLIDRFSASASEIFAGAIQDYGRGIIVGEPTFGKGTVQSVAPLDRDGKLGQLKITIAQFFRVNGESTQHRGVVPDVLFPTALGSDAQGERGLDNALPWAEIAAAEYDAWSKNKVSYTDIQKRHESRYRSSELFDVLIKELKEQREARAERSVTLVEKERQEEIAEQQADRQKRDELYRAELDASENNDDNDDVSAPDIILEEAANVLNDVIDFLPRR